MGLADSSAHNVNVNGVFCGVPGGARWSLEDEDEGEGEDEDEDATELAMFCGYGMMGVREQKGVRGFQHPIGIIRA